MKKDNKIIIGLLVLFCLIVVLVVVQVYFALNTQKANIDTIETITGAEIMQSDTVRGWSADGTLGGIEAVPLPTIPAVNFFPDNVISGTRLMWNNTPFDDMPTTFYISLMEDDGPFLEISCTKTVITESEFGKDVIEVNNCEIAYERLKYFFYDALDTYPELQSILHHHKIILTRQDSLTK